MVDHRLHALPELGRGDEGTALVCLHDEGVSGREFQELLPLLGRDRSVYAPDLPGSGESDAPTQRASVGDLAAAVGDFIGEIALLTDVPRTATVTATVDSLVLVLTDRAFERVVAQIPSVRERVEAALAERKPDTDF